MKATTKNPKTPLYYDYFDYDLYDYYVENYPEDYLMGYSFENLLSYFDIVLALKQVYTYASIISLIVNIPHLFVLTRKELRSNLIYIVMTGICICDLLHASGKLASSSMTWDFWYIHQNCAQGLPYFHVMTDIISKTMQIISRRCSGLLALFIAGLRSFSVVFPMSNAVNFMMKPKSGVIIVFFFGSICTGWGATFYFQTKIKRLNRCPPGDRPSYVPYQFESRQKWETTYRFIDGTLSIFITLTYVSVAISLIIALCLAQKRRKNLKRETKNHTSLMIMMMAFTFLLSEAAYGIIFVLNFLIFDGFGEQTYFIELDNIALTLMIINSITHCFICFLMSSQYRDTVKRIVCCADGEKKEMKVTVVKSSENVTTMKTSKITDRSKKTF